MNKNPQRSAGFRVLKAPDVPSVLLELGYLSNEKDDIALSSPEWRDKAVARMTEAVAAFFAERGDAANLSDAAKDPTAVGTLPAASPRGAGEPDSDGLVDKAALQDPSTDAQAAPR